MTEYYGRLSFGAGCNVHQLWFGRFWVIEAELWIDPESGAERRNIAILMEPRYVHVREYNRGDRGPEYSYDCMLESRWRADLSYIGENEAGLEGMKVTYHFQPEYAKGWQKYYRGEVEGSYKNVTQSAEAEDQRRHGQFEQELRGLVEKRERAEAERKEQELKYAEEKRLAELAEAKKKEEADRKLREEHERRLARERLSYQELQRLVAEHDPRVAEAHRMNEIETHLKVLLPLVKSIFSLVQ